MARKTSMDKMAAQLEDIAKDITGTTTTKKSYAWDRIDNAVTAIANAVGVELPDKKYVTKKERVADIIKTIADADVSGGGDIMSQVNWIKVIDNVEVTFTGNYASKQTPTLITVEQFLLPFQFIKMSIDQNEIAEYAVCENAVYDDETNFYNVRYVNYNAMGDIIYSVTNVARLAQEDTGMYLTEFGIEDLRAEDAYQEGDTATVSLWLGTLVELPE